MRIVAGSAALVAALVLGGCVDRNTEQTATLEDQIFVSAALAHAQSELALAQMAERKAHTPSVVAYAKRVEQHSAPLSQQLAALAHATGTAADTAHTPNPAQFEQLSGEAFERAYIASQIEDQQNALDDFTFAAAQQNNPALRKLASDAVPHYRQDLADAIDVVYDIPFEPVAAQDTGAGLVGRRPARP
jgi:putative membrane protein